MRKYILIYSLDNRLHIRQFKTREALYRFNSKNNIVHFVWCCLWVEGNSIEEATGQICETDFNGL